jgi:hypothetical protein
MRDECPSKPQEKQKVGSPSYMALYNIVMFLFLEKTEIQRMIGSVALIVTLTLR